MKQLPPKEYLSENTIKRVAQKEWILVDDENWVENFERRYGAKYRLKLANKRYFGYPTSPVLYARKSSSKLVNKYLTKQQQGALHVAIHGLIESGILDTWIQVSTSGWDYIANKTANGHGNNNFAQNLNENNNNQRMIWLPVGLENLTYLYDLLFVTSFAALLLVAVEKLTYRKENFGRKNIQYQQCQKI